MNLESGIMSMVLWFIGLNYTSQLYIYSIFKVGFPLSRSDSRCCFAGNHKCLCQFVCRDGSKYTQLADRKKLWKMFLCKLGEAGVIASVDAPDGFT